MRNFAYLKIGKPGTLKKEEKVLQPLAWASFKLKMPKLMSDQNKLNYFGEGSDEGPQTQTAGEEPATAQPPSAPEAEEKINPRYDRWRFFTGI